MLANQQGRPFLFRSPTNLAHLRQSRPDSGFGFQGKAFESIQAVPFSFGNGPARRAFVNHVHAFTFFCVPLLATCTRTCFSEPIHRARSFLAGPMWCICSLPKQISLAEDSPLYDCFPTQGLNRNSNYTGKAWCPMQRVVVTSLGLPDRGPIESNPARRTPGSECPPHTHSPPTPQKVRTHVSD